MKRIMFAGTNSGCGKTTITCAVLQSLVNRKIDVTSFKCGPDYIDPLFHKNIIGTPSYNLDSYLFDEETIKYLLIKNSGDISVIEGVMGFYDGMGFTEKGSTYDISKITDTDVILVINGRGMSLSLMAQIKGFKEFRDNNIKGVIFNNISESVYKGVADEVKKIGLKPLGFMPKLKEIVVESRHLGLVTPDEIDGLKDKMKILSDYAERYIDIDGILEIAENSRDIKTNHEKEHKISDVTIAVTKDRAFCFIYEDNLNLLREMGANIVTFSPLKNEPVPECDGLIICGGYPEIYASVLERNLVTLNSVKENIENGIPCIAECGGFMYLHNTMEDIGGVKHKTVGIVNGDCYKTDSLQNFGYMEMTANRDNILCKKGEIIRAREFHYFKSDSEGDCFTAVKSNGKTWNLGNEYKNTFASFAHLHFYANTKAAENFIKHCEEYKCTKQEI